MMQNVSEQQHMSAASFCQSIAMVHWCRSAVLYCCIILPIPHPAAAGRGCADSHGGILCCCVRPRGAAHWAGQLLLCRPPAQHVAVAQLAHWTHWV